MKRAWIWGITGLVACAAWLVFAPTRVTDARVRALVAELGPMVEAETGGELGDDLLTAVYTEDELLAHFEAQRREAGLFEPRLYEDVDEDGNRRSVDATTDGVALWASKSVVAHYDPSDHTIRVCSTHVDDVASMTGSDEVELLRVILLHELVHAVDGTVHSERWTEAVEGDDEPARAAHFLFEGHATLIARRLAGRLGLAEAAGASEAKSSESWAQTAEYLRSADFLARVEREGGRAALDAALHDPPVTLDELLYPDLAEPLNAGNARERGVDAALLALAESHGDCVAPRLRDAPRHELEGRIYRSGSSEARSLASALTQHMEVRGVHSDGRRDDEQSFARASVFDTEEAADQYLREVDTLAMSSWELERVQHADVFDSLEEYELDQRPLQGNGWEGVTLSRRWEFSRHVGAMIDGHIVQAGELEIRRSYARRGRVVLELFPVAGDGGPLESVSRFNAAFALIEDSR